MSRPGSRQRRSPSPSEYRNARTSNEMGGEFSVTSPADSPFSPNRAASQSSASTRALEGPGRRSNERILRRAARSNSPPIDARRPKSQDLMSSSSRVVRLAEVAGSGSVPDLLAPERIPNARLGHEVPIAHNTNILGSSQLSTVCQGDFCHFNLMDWEPSASSIASSSHRKSNQPGGDYKKALFSAGLLENSIDESLNGSPMFKWNNNSILVARQQAPLVKMFLERHMRGEDAPLIIEDDYSDMAVGGKLPARYYQEVPVCHNCYQIYNIIDRARAKALRPAGSAHRAQYNANHEEVYDGGIGLTADAARDLLKHELTVHQSQQLQTLAKRSKGPAQMQTQTQAAEGDDKGRSKAKQAMDGSMRAAVEAIEGLTKLDVAEIRTMVKPPAAVEVVVEAVMILLTGKYMTFKEAYRLLGGGEAFLNMLKDFNVADVTDKRLRMIELYVDNPLFRPENVAPISHCASKFCAWVHGMVHAARYNRGLTHQRTDTVRPTATAAAAPLATATTTAPSASAKQLKPLRKNSNPSAEEELTFVQKLEQMKARRTTSPSRALISREDRKLPSSKKPLPGLGEKEKVFSEPYLVTPNRMGAKFDPPGPAPSLADLSTTSLAPATSPSDKRMTKREAKAMKAMQAKSIDRLAAQTAIEGSVGVVGPSKVCRCADGVTRLPYVVMGKYSPTVEKCNFVVVHDFFDTYDATAILFKQLVQRHSEGCQVLCFNYPGQAHTTWPRLSQAERERGGKELMLSNDWLADRLHELLRHAEEAGDLLLSGPFHLVGVGVGASIATAFCQRYAYHDLYVNSLRSVVSVNGFMYPDAQLSSVLHAAYQVFESTPHSRPDIAVSYWSRFVFSEDYLARVNPNLALNIYTAVSNPITNDGRVRLVRGCLGGKDLRGALSPESFVKLPAPAGMQASAQVPSKFQPIQVPVVVLQSTEDGLVHASNVDNFLVGRSSKHLWSHMLNVPNEELMMRTFDVNAQWVGRMSNGPDDYASFSTLGKQGLRMMLDSLRNPRGAFVLWTRTGHIVQQEYKAAFLDLMDALACPSEEYYGLNIEPKQQAEYIVGAVVEPDLTWAQRTRTSTAASASSTAEQQPLLLLSIDGVLPAPPLAVAPPAAEMIRPGTEHPSQEQEPYSVPENLDDAIDHILKSVVLPGVTSVVEADETEGREEEEAEEETEEEVATSQHSDPPVVATPVRQSSRSLTAEHLVASPVATPNHAVNPAPTAVTPIPTMTSSPVPVKVLSPAPTSKVLESYWKSPEVGHSPVEDIVSSHAQRSKKQWLTAVPNVQTALELEAELRAKQREYQALEERLRRLREDGSQSHLQVDDRQESEGQDVAMLAELSEELERRQRERDLAEMQRRVRIQEVEDLLVREGAVPAFSGLAVVQGLAANQIVIVDPVRALPPIHYTEPAELPKAIVEAKDVISRLDQMVLDEQEARRRGVLSVHEFEKIKMQMAERQLERDQKLRALSEEELESLYDSCSVSIGRVVRGFNARRRTKKLALLRELERKQRRCIVVMQSLTRGFLGRRRFKRIKAIYLTKLRGEHSAIEIQRHFRGHAARKFFTKLRRWHAAGLVQRAFRGFLGRNAFKREKRRLELMRRKQMAATKIQSTWRMKVAKEEYRSLRIHILGAVEIQRVFRGYLGRKRMARKRMWENTKPGPERIKLGLQFIEESKQAFERQQEEIDALHRAQERAEARVSHIHAELKDSEKELVVLERELQEIDQIERDLQVLSHERNLLSQGIEDAAGMPRLAGKAHKDLVMGRESQHENDPMAERKRRAEAYALEMTIQLKRAEREKKRQELEIEFASVFQEVEKKRKALQRLELSLADMEATRERKDREFRRLQKNLMQLLLEQKQELDELREKGLELETATATTAAAAVATAQKAKEHEKRSNAMFSQTEELMKFQFMSMSLSYFSSLNMLRGMRDMNADTTSAAIALSADASATAASAAAAANLPSVKKLQLGANDFVEASIRKKKEELLLAEKAQKELQVINTNPLPANVRTWSVHDVSRWLDSLSLSQYKEAFLEGSVDGPFLLELREEDLVQVLNIKHKLHVRKLLVSREKLKPLSQQELQYKEVVEREDRADAAREEIGVPALDTVFSQARNGRIKRVEESLNLGFPVDAEDEKGNTLLLVAAQNSNKRLIEMLILRGASINHQNAQGNTALHYALAFDPEGPLGEYLIEHGADDTIENVENLTPYDGVAK